MREKVETWWMMKEMRYYCEEKNEAYYLKWKVRITNSTWQEMIHRGPKLYPISQCIHNLQIIIRPITECDYDNKTDNAPQDASRNDIRNT